jgi:mono/diheme cytochrome c family protein
MNARRISLITGMAALAVGAAASASGASTPAGATVRTRPRETAAALTPKRYRLTAVLKASGASGRLSGTLTRNGSAGTITWKLALEPAKPATRAVVRSTVSSRSRLLITLCHPCRVGAHGTRRIAGAALATTAAGRAGVIVQVGKRTLRGTLAAAAAGGSTGPPSAALVAKGKALVKHFGCAGCHTITGAKSTGPTWKGLYGSKVHETDGKTVIADESYLIGVITDPSTLKVAGYDSGIMAEVIPPGDVSTVQAEAIAAYIETLK